MAAQQGKTPKELITGTVMPITTRDLVEWLAFKRYENAMTQAALEKARGSRRSSSG